MTHYTHDDTVTINARIRPTTADALRELARQLEILGENGLDNKFLLRDGDLFKASNAVRYRADALDALTAGMPERVPADHGAHDSLCIDGYCGCDEQANELYQDALRRYAEAQTAEVARLCARVGEAENAMDSISHDRDEALAIIAALTARLGFYESDAFRSQVADVVAALRTAASDTTR